MNTFDNYTPEIPYGNKTATQEEKPVENLNSNALDEKNRKKSGGSKPKGKKSKPINEKEPRKKEGKSWTEKVKEFATSTNMRLIFGVLVGCLAVYITVAFLSYFTDCIKDQALINNHAIGASPDVSNAAGEGGARLSEFLINESFGLGSIVIVVWLIAMSLKLLTGYPKFKSVNFTIKCFVALITVSLIVGLATISLDSPVNWGGFHGRYVNEFIIHFIGGAGAGLLCIFMLTLFVVICLRDVINWIARIHRAKMEKKRIEREKREEEERRLAELAKMEMEERHDDARTGETVVPETETEGDDITLSFTGVSGDEIDESPIYSLPASETSTVTVEKEYFNIDRLPEASDSGNSTDKSDESDMKEGDIDDYQVDDSDSDTESETDDKAPMRVNVNQIGQSDKNHYDPREGSGVTYKYKFPPFDLLNPGEEKIIVNESEQTENEERIKKTLLDFKIPITKISATVGPTVTLYEIVPDNGVKIAKIRSLVDDIALSLAAIGVRIIAPIPGKGTVGIEVANKDPQTVSMRTVIKSNRFQESRYELPIALGSTISNDVYIADLAKMPHLLVAGATGQGKSVGLNAIIASLLYCKTPDELKFVMIDPKQVEFSLYAKLKDHYMAMLPEEEECVVTDTNKVEAILSSLCIEMDNRYQLLKQAHVRKITEYNDKIRAHQLNPTEGHRYLPYIVVIVDEFSDLIMTSGKTVEMPIARLAQKARAVGMHVIIATQRPSTNVITGIIKANFPARIAFKVSSGVDSKTILDATGAQQLIGRGDMLIANNSETVRVQCAFIDTPEVEEICNYIERQPYPTGPYILPDPVVVGDEEGSALAASMQERDPLFEEVARLVVSSNVASTSSLQRRYSIGYNRAGKIMDQLEAANIVGPSREGKPRTVLVNDPIMLEEILSRDKN